MQTNRLDQLQQRLAPLRDALLESCGLQDEQNPALLRALMSPGAEPGSSRR